jgi:hypothetical protein
MTKNLVAENGTVVHAPSNTKRNPVLCSNMRRQSGHSIIEATFKLTDAPVSCKNCCRKLGIEAPKTPATRKPAKKAPRVIETLSVDENRAEVVELATAYAGMDGVSLMDALHDMAIYHAMYVMQAGKRRR